MSQKPSKLRFEGLEDRTLLSVNVDVGVDTIHVIGQGADDYVTIGQHGHYLVVKDHDAVAGKVDLRGYDGRWNLYVDLDGGNDHLKIAHIHHPLGHVQVHTGGTLGDDGGNQASDNDRVEIHGLSAHSISIDTGAAAGGQPTVPEAAAATQGYTFGVPYYDNDHVKLYHVSTYDGNIHVQTGTEVHLGFNPLPAPAGAANTIVDVPGADLQDNDHVYVRGLEVDHGDVHIETGTSVHGTVWHDQNSPPGGGALHDAGPIDGLPHDGVHLEDRDHVSVRHVEIHHGSLLVETGFEANLATAGDDTLELVDAAFDSFEGPYQFGAHIDDRDHVQLYRVKVYEQLRSITDTGLVATTFQDGIGGVEVHTSANIFNADPWSYLAAYLNDDDTVKLKKVHVHGSLLIWTGADIGGQVGDPSGGNGQSDKDHVALKYVHQGGPGTTVEVSLGRDDDHLLLYYSKLHGLAFFDGGDGYDAKKVHRTYFAEPPTFVNFHDDID